MSTTLYKSPKGLKAHTKGFFCKKMNSLPKHCQVVKNGFHAYLQRRVAKMPRQVSFGKYVSPWTVLLLAIQ